MTINIFVSLLFALCAVSALLTEAIKTFIENRQGTPSANVIALIDAFFVGGIGTVCAYIVLGIAFTPSSIVAIFAMIVAIWIGSMIGYDKVTQLVNQITAKG